MDQFAIDSTEDGRKWSRITYALTPGQNRKAKRSEVRKKASSAVADRDSSVIKAVVLELDEDTLQYEVIAEYRMR